jgi:SH3-like domain-containing protein
MIAFSRPFRLALAAAMLGGLVSQAIPALDRTKVTGLPLPRFVSLKSGDVNARRGPGLEYDIAYNFVHAGLPVEITQEFDTWRKIRDSEGAEGWVYHSLLSGKRTALVAPWEASGTYAAHVSGNASAAVAVYFQPGAIVSVEKCTGSWCEISASGYDGWIEQERLWGVYPGETFDD